MSDEVKQIQLPKHYDSIDSLPMFNWNKVHETTDMKWLLEIPKKINIEQQVELSKVWTVIYEEYVKQVGFSEVYKSILLKKMELANLQLQKIDSGDETIENFISRTKGEITNMQNKNKGGDVNKRKVIIEKFLGFRIPLKEVTVKEFYNYDAFVTQQTKR